MSVLCARNVPPVVVSIAATLFLATATSHDLPFLADAPAPLVVAEVQRCVAQGRETDACFDEADGKALIEGAEALLSADRAAPPAGRR